MVLWIIKLYTQIVNVHLNLSSLIIILILWFTILNAKIVIIYKNKILIKYYIIV